MSLSDFYEEIETPFQGYTHNSADEIYLDVETAINDISIYMVELDSKRKEEITQKEKEREEWIHVSEIGEIDNSDYMNALLERQECPLDEITVARLDCERVCNNPPPECAVKQTPLPECKLPPTIPTVKQLTISLQVPTATGKTHAYIDGVPQIIKYLRAQENRSPIVIFVPTHDLAEEIKERFQNGSQRGYVKVYKGITQPDPRDPKYKMCRRSEIAALITQNGGSMIELCGGMHSKKQCPHFEICGYQQQKIMNANIWIVPVQKLYGVPPEKLKHPALKIFDEEFMTASLVGFDKNSPMKVELDIVRKHLGKIFFNRFLLETLLSALEKQTDGPLDVRILIKSFSNPCQPYVSHEQYIINSLRDLTKELWKRITKISPSSSDKELKDTAAQLEKAGTMRLIQLITLIEKSIHMRRSPYVTKRGESLYLYDRKKIHRDWDSPTILLNATMPTQLNQLMFRHPIVDAELSCPDQHTNIVQITDTKLAQSAWIPKQGEVTRNHQKLIRSLMVLAKKYRGSAVQIGEDQVSVVCILSKKNEEVIRKIGGPEGVHFMHYGATAGIDRYKNVPCGVIVGRQEAPLDAMEHMAEVATGMPIQKIATPPEGSDAFHWYDEVAKNIQLRDGRTELVLGTRHPDSVVEELRSQVNEAELIQAIGRFRAIRRTAENPLELFVLTNVALPMEVDQVTTWKDLSSCEVESAVMVAGACPINKGGMTRCFPTIWKNKDKAKYAIKKAKERGLVPKPIIETATWSAMGGKIPNIKY